MILSRSLAALRKVPVSLALWLFVPMGVVGAFGKIFQSRLTNDKAPGNPSTLHAFKWMIDSLRHPTYMNDSWMPMWSALDVLHGPHASTLFQTLFFGRHIKFQYPPSSLLPMEPIAALGLLNAPFLNWINAWLLVPNAVLIGLLAYGLFRPAPETPRLPDREGVTVLAVAASFCFYPIVQAQNIGQIQMWIDVLFSGACLLWLGGRTAWAGVAVGLACAIKPQLALFLPWALVWRQWTFALGFVAVLIPIELAALARYGLGNHLGYLNVLSHLSRNGESYQFNQSVNGLMNRLLFNGCNNCQGPSPIPPFNSTVHAATLVTTVLLLAIAFLPPLFNRRRGPTLLDFATTTLVFTMASPIAWYHHYGVVLPVFMVAYRSLLAVPDPHTRRRWLGLLFVAWVLMSNYIGIFNLSAGTRLNVLQSHCFFGAILLLAVLVREIAHGGLPANLQGPPRQLSRSPAT